MYRSLSLALLVTALAGCQARTAPDVDAQARKAFIHDVQHAIIGSIATAFTSKQVGVARLQLILDRHSVPVGCKTLRSQAKDNQNLPGDVQRTNEKALAKLVEAQCWKTIYPVVPNAMYGEKDTLELIAPLIVQLPLGNGLAQANARRAFFWEHLLRDQPVTSVGRASVFYQANAQGKLEACLVQLHPHPLRPDDFRLDGDLQSRLNSRCLALDLSRMPGFAPDMHGVAKGSSELDYAPWRVGRP
ncbi:hypothetical protein F3J44_19065 [Pantoea sp. Tr-811]|uniref:hypothetical protein n=1 Tax=Pantoea sp. Tr-811 TaxID=2608361 RepID=UPI0014243821|nr:hypothetical protein [Pantoea sp. Tr-811]NIF28471.1 hypothetical protein [Pantoea sp. Tr-811]